MSLSTEEHGRRHQTWPGAKATFTDAKPDVVFANVGVEKDSAGPELARSDSVEGLESPAEMRKVVEAQAERQVGDVAGRTILPQGSRRPFQPFAPDIG